jgi:hypothetical protein
MVLGTLVISLTLLMHQVSAQEEALTEAKRADIDQLLQLTTAPVLIQLVSKIAIKDVTESLQAAMPGVGQAALTSATEETQLAIREFATEFLKDLHPAYNSRLTHAEIREILAFYKTPPCPKLLSAAPALQTDAELAAQKRVRDLYPRITQRVVERLRREGLMR